MGITNNDAFSYSKQWTAVEQKDRSAGSMQAFESTVTYKGHSYKLTLGIDAEVAKKLGSTPAELNKFFVNLFETCKDSFQSMLADVHSTPLKLEMPLKDPTFVQKEREQSEREYQNFEARENDVQISEIAIERFKVKLSGELSCVLRNPNPITTKRAEADHTMDIQAAKQKRIYRK